MPKPKLLVSSCLLGVPCRYDAKAKASDPLLELLKKNSLLIEIVPVCPEMLGNLSCPRVPCEIQKNTRQVLSATGLNKTANYLDGANKALDLCRAHGIKVAILKESSPSCGSSLIYDGTFSSKKIKGMGITTELLMHNGISVFNEDQAKEAIQKVLKDKE
ncbi:MAG: DUF523 domain-containing protein [Burkholderiales bacterium]|nr:DUF523 domain-containing protein [Burkholderiales bacterium]